MTYTTSSILTSLGDGSNSDIGHFVFLNFKSRNNVDSSDPWLTNRIALKADSIQIDTNRTVPSFALPFSGAITGESTTLAIDLGMATKSISIGGIITEQVIVKKGSDGVLHSKTMTAQEVFQLIHASVDSSFIQRQQNIGELVILYPSRVGNDYEFFAGIDENTDIINCPLVPWTWASRELDQELSLGGSDYPSIISNTSEVVGVQGFIRSFGGAITPEPFITFNLTFEVAFIPFR